MNYRHAYHAGNRTEIFKHAILVQILEHLRRKDKPFFVLDSHAGLGVYDLDSDEARETGEAGNGIGRLVGHELSTAAAYLQLVRLMNPANAFVRYPGSPRIIQSFLRDNDRLVACELHPDDVNGLRANFRQDRRVSVRNQDGYQAIRALVPPPQKRGLIFIDPPFESPSEFDDLAQALIDAQRRWPSGILSAWYPVKSRAALRGLKETLRLAEIKECMSAQLLFSPLDGINLVGSGMLLVNPPWQMDRLVRKLGSEILDQLEEKNGQISVEWITPPE
jgi:23S rRNA (adenine2030-N6)-methyltransferase